MIKTISDMRADFHIKGGKKKKKKKAEKREGKEEERKVAETGY